MPFDPNYAAEPEWANWMILIEMFIIGVAAGTFLFVALANIAGDRRGDREFASRLGLIPMPIMFVVAFLLIIDLGRPERFMNLLIRSPFAPERGPGPFMWNGNSPMVWGSWVLPLFGLVTLIAFLDGLRHVGRLPGVTGGKRARGGFMARVSDFVESFAHNPIYLVVGALFAAVIAGYSGVMLNVMNVPVWGDNFLAGALYVAFSALSGAAVAAIVSERVRATARTAGAVRSVLVMYAGVAGVLLLIWLVSLATQQRLSAVIAAPLVAPVFWIGVVGAGVAFPLWVLLSRTRARVANYALGRLAVVGIVVLVGAFAFRYAMLWSSIAAGA